MRYQSGEHLPLADAPVDIMLVPRGAMGVAVDEPGHAALAQRRGDGVGVDVHDRLGLGLDRSPAAGAQRRADTAPDEERQGEKAAAMHRVLPPGAEALIADVVGAQLIAMHDQRRRAMKVVHHRVRKQVAPLALREALAEQEIAVAALQIHRRSRPRKLGEGARDAGSERIAQLVVAQPEVEQVAQDVERRGAAGRAAHECVKRGDELRAASPTGASRK